MRPYISIDIETTGIDDRCEILQISGVVDTGEAVEVLKTFDLPIRHKVIEYAETYAMGMNAELLKKMMDKEFVTYKPSDAIAILLTVMNGAAITNMDESRPAPKVIFAGKNVAGFDIPKIKRFISKYGTYQNQLDFDKLCHYKTIDVGSLYFDTFQDNVSLSKINKLTGRNAVSHNALDDAWDVVYAIRHKLGTK